MRILSGFLALCIVLVLAPADVGWSAPQDLFDPALSLVTADPVDAQDDVDKLGDIATVEIRVLPAWVRFAAAVQASQFVRHSRRAAHAARAPPFVS